MIVMIALSQAHLTTMMTCSMASNDTTNLSISPRCLVSQGNKKVNNDSDVVLHAYTYDELVDLVKSMTISLENKKSKMRNMKNGNLILEDSCDDLRHLLDMLQCLVEELNLTHVMI